MNSQVLSQNDGTLSRERLEAAYQFALAALLAERHPDGYWVGELSSSALSTATAISALSLVQRHHRDGRYQLLIDRGLEWLAAHQNADGGWGDTVKSFSNISTTMLCRAAFHITRGEPGTLTSTVQRSLEKVEAWLFAKYGNTPAELAEAVRQRYGKDRTFSVPILTTCAIAGLVPWSEVPALPFELACLPQSWFRFLRLHVVSYALPALIAIGQAVYHHRKPWNPLTLAIRALSRKRSLKVLERIQPSNGGFLEATPLTSFVTLSLGACGLASHPVARKGSEFLASSARPDGSWPIDTNLSTWVTTLAINALSAADDTHLLDASRLHKFLSDQQFTSRHPYTGAAPGGWAWTPLPGGVPDADDTAGAVVALSNLFPDSPLPSCCDEALAWLRGIHNSDGGWPTFCRGWGHLPFDRSGADLTAHSLRAFARANPAESVLTSGLDYLEKTQRPDGSWLPLWFGNQHAPDDENPVYGTARVLAAYRDLDKMNTKPARRGVAFLLSAQNADGGWGGGENTPSSVEETALAVEILLDAPPADAGGSLHAAVNKGLTWLVEQVESGGLKKASPIGFYFAKLWYFEKLYPLIFTVAALGRARRKHPV